MSTRWRMVCAIFSAALLSVTSWAYIHRHYPIGFGGAPPGLADARAAALADASWDGKRAMRDISMLLRHAPRSPGTRGQAATLAYIESELARTHGFAVRRQSFTRRRADGSVVRLVNLVARLNPQARLRLLVGTHHDSLVRAYRDPIDPAAPMPGANNSASGVAALLETARVLAQRPPSIGVDLVFFDGEEGPNALGGAETAWQPLGSSYFVRRLSEFYPTPPAATVIVDMICREGLQLQPEPQSLVTGRDELRRIWRIGTTIAPGAFVWRLRQSGVGDDHKPFAAAGIPALLLIDFRPVAWFNTRNDTIDKCSAQSLSAVGRTIARYIYSER